MIDTTVLSMVLTINDSKTKDQKQATAWLASIALATEANLPYLRQDDVSAACINYTMFAATQDEYYFTEAEDCLLGKVNAPKRVVGN